ncbi:MAG: LysR family transcriptional regulator [Gemmatimonadota bacterium]
MELRHLRYFIAVAEESTVVGAAQRLRIAQPALTRQIHDLEREIGLELFARGARGMELTPAGDVCLTAARRILTRLESAIALAKGSSRGVVGRCVICVGARALSSGLIARVVARVRSQYPGIELSVTEAIGPRQWKALQLLEADIGLGLPISHEYTDLVSETMNYDIFDSIKVSKAHPLAVRRTVSIFELSKEPFLFWKAGLAPEFTRQLRTEFARIGFQPTIKRECEQVSQVSSLVSAGQGWTLFPGKTTGLAPSDSTIVALTDFKVPLAHAMVWRRDERRPVVHTVLDAIRRQFEEERTRAGNVTVAAIAPPETIPASGTPNGPILQGQAIELRHLRYYCAVVEARSFGRAAKLLELTQPALSRQIRDLEHVVGLELLQRGARGATTTPAGESFYRSARRILHGAAALHSEAHRARRGISRCVIAAVPTTHARILVTALLRRCLDEMPTVEVTLEEFHTPEQPAELRAARVDVGLCHATPLSPVAERGLRRERLTDDVVNRALVSAHSPLARRASIDFADLIDIPFLFANRAFQPGLHDQLFSTFERHGFRPRVDQTFGGLKTIWAMVADGRGWALGFQSQRDDPPPGTATVPISGFAMRWGIDVLFRADESRTLILRVVEMLRDAARAHGTPTSA